MLYNMVHGLRDFGVYAITFMVSFVIKKDLTSISFDGKLLWDHLYDCYKQWRLIPFPSAKEHVKRNTAKSISFELICSWWMPWAKQNAWSVELQMTECDSSMEWFHQKHQRIPDQVFLGTLEWLCNACQQLSVRYLVILIERDASCLTMVFWIP